MGHQDGSAVNLLAFQSADLNAIPETHKLKETQSPKKLSSGLYTPIVVNTGPHSYTSYTHIHKYKKSKCISSPCRKEHTCKCSTWPRSECGQPGIHRHSPSKENQVYGCTQTSWSLPPRVQDLVLPCPPGRYGCSQTLIHNFLPSVSFPRWLHFSLKPLCWGKPSSVSVAQWSACLTWKILGRRVKIWLHSSDWTLLLHRATVRFQATTLSTSQPALTQLQGIQLFWPLKLPQAYTQIPTNTNK